MWRNNVIRVRNCSSRAPKQHTFTAKKRWYSSRKLDGEALPIENDEFDTVFRDLISSDSWREHTKIGLAVSGGVDSMALATLYKIFWKSQTHEGKASLPPELHGFVVDHKVRPESTEEAKWVAAQLRSQLEIPTTIIPLIWPSAVTPASFESDARKLRYQALGRACRDKGINSLMVAHHADDQGETVMMRLLTMRHRSGLQGMRKVSGIPECEGIHGVHHSGGVPFQTLHYTKNQSSMGHDIPFEVEQGGVQILRPLLKFNKSRLIATSKKHGTPWVEDKTNQDQTLTQRNAIRHVVRNHALPQALSSSSLTRVAERMQCRIDARELFAEQLFTRMPLKLDIQTGSLTVRLPLCQSLLARPISSSTDRAEAADNAQCLLTRIAELVSPVSRLSVSAVASVVPQIWPELEFPYHTSSAKTAHPKAFTALGIWWQPWEGIEPLSGNEKCEMDWLLARAPLSSREQKSPDSRIVFPPKSMSVPLNQSGMKPTNEEWHMFDNRYWIRVQNKTNQELILRYMTADELKALSSKKRHNARVIGARTSIQHYHIQATLPLVKPQSLLRSLPALFIRSIDGTETVVSLPTLDLYIGNKDSAKSRDTLCEWKIRYKKIDLAGKALSDVVIPGIKKSAVLATAAASLQLKEHYRRSQAKGAAPKRDKGHVGLDYKKYNASITPASQGKITNIKHPSSDTNFLNSNDEAQDSADSWDRILFGTRGKNSDEKI